MPIGVAMKTRNNSQMTLWKTAGQNSVYWVNRTS